MIDVDIITPKDIDEILELARIAHKESFYRNFQFDETGAKNIIINSCGHGDYFGVKCSSSGKIIGYLGGMLSKMPFSTQLIGVDNGFYLEPEYRGTKAFIKMINHFFDWCADKNVMPFFVIHYGDDNSSTYTSIEKFGLVERGRIFTGDPHVR